MAQILGSSYIVLPDNSKAVAEEFLEDKLVLFYFSAGWCPPCRHFTPKLKKFYEELKAAGKNIEVVWISRDRAEEHLLDYYKGHHGSWPYLEFGNPLIDELLAKYEIATIPGLKLVKPDGSVVVADARTEVQEKGSDPEALFNEWLERYIA